MAIPEVITSGPNSVSQLSEIKSIRSSECDSIANNQANGSHSVERILHSPSCSISSMPEMRRMEQTDEQFAIHPRSRSSGLGMDWIEPDWIEPGRIESIRIEPLNPDMIEQNRSEPVLVQSDQITGNRKRYNSVRLVGTSKDYGKICVASRVS